MAESFKVIKIMGELGLSLFRVNLIDLIEVLRELLLNSLDKLVFIFEVLGIVHFGQTIVYALAPIHRYLFLVEDLFIAKGHHKLAGHLPSIRVLS